jgi:carboxylesterase
MEREYINILPEGEPFSHIGKKDIGILFIHGFTSTPESMRDIAQHFAEEDYHVELPRLSGHGTDNWKNMVGISYKDWLNDVDTAYEKLKERASSIFVTGLSMGGTLTLYIAEKHPHEVKGIILINPVIFIHDKLIRFIPILKYIMPPHPGIGSDIKKEKVFEPAYKYFPVESAYELFRLVEYVRKNLKKVEAPLLMMASEKDHLVPVIDKRHIYLNVSSKTKDILILENSYHVATMDNDQDKIIEGIENWILKNK